MVKPKEITYKLLPEWSIVQRGSTLLLSGGADARYEIELEDDGLSFFAGLQPDASFVRSDLSERDARTLEELVTAEVVVPVLSKGKVFTISSIGDVNEFSIASVKNETTADLLLIVRTTSTYAELLDKIDYRGVAKPHLFVDMAFHHTFSIGPLVFPGETACIACLQGRITTRWGDEKPPTAPKMTSKYLSLAAELVKTELDRISDGDTSLTNKTVSWNFQDRAVREDQLLKVPICPICTQNKIDHNGVIALPWGKDEVTTNTV